MYMYTDPDAVGSRSAVSSRVLAPVRAAAVRKAVVQSGVVQSAAWLGAWRSDMHVLRPSF
jgi:hypothetical protein